MFECCPTGSRRANSHFVVCNQLLNKYGEALAHRKCASTMAKSGLIRLDGTSIIYFVFLHKVSRVVACCEFVVVCFGQLLNEKSKILKMGEVLQNS